MTETAYETIIAMDLDKQPKEELLSLYHWTHEHEADKRWSEKTLRVKLDNWIIDYEEQQRQREEKRKAEQIAEEFRQQRIAARGTLAEFVAKGHNVSEYDKPLRYIARRALQTIEDFDDKLENFIDKLRADSTYALSWSLSEFKWSAQRDVAVMFRKLFEAGAPASEIKLVMQREAVRSARYANRSTSPTSNLSDDVKREALFEFVEMLDY